MQNIFGVEPDIVTFGSAIAACGNSGFPTSGFEAEKLLAMMIQKYNEGEAHLKPNTVRALFEYVDSFFMRYLTAYRQVSIWISFASTV